MLFSSKLAAKLIFKCINRCYNINALRDIQKAVNQAVKCVNSILYKKNHFLFPIKKDYVLQAKHCERKNKILKKVHLYHIVKQLPYNKGYTKKVIQSIKKNKAINLQHNIKELMFRFIKVSIAHAMDPIQRSGETVSSNIVSAKKYNRDNRLGKKSHSKKSASFFKVLMNMIFFSMLPIMLKHNIDVIGMLSDKKPRKEEDIKKSHQRLF
ncbi:hypothetical protein HL033_04340 [Neoehrlichia mikurensis]|uniref:Uncharacterized protein n=1 Tax=Neoehrlichia mikurensis TaxID=89586 RepID=A0A9Q9C0G2_9RICK|nr:hypothetical protein [Neoehrlichia mikurensis]QXK91943.1 hypothetical protein IAH97_04335 [Neoehrlichia mikurensis]QXK93156.1 hypothetical protein HUN61_04330 [Neoehrlichia mikurensis]QXK93636.1 hypothetical protein HL033_04340 [Neoehrlichia mikurensis]UTO55409.1 hypothetical protein LUA82_04520 [Neoehrlichia mikurensis]UTO56328.1 hypothetical protein LUA81_04470 [Neoehrlichia mikurensis]